MSSSSPIPPAERARGGKGDLAGGCAGSRRAAIVPWILVGLWCVLMLFGLVSIVNPPWLRSLSESGATAEAVSYADRGDQRVREGDFRGGLWWYEKALKADPNRIATRVNAAVAYGQLGRHDEGMRLLREVLGGEVRQRGVVLYNLAELHRRKGEIREAIRRYREALDAGGRVELIHARLAECYAQVADPIAARDAYRNAVVAWVDPANHYRNMLVAAAGAIDEADPEHARLDEALARGVAPEDLERYDLEMLRAHLAADPERARLIERLKEIESKLP